MVINDSLGIGEELEAEMQSLIDTYECEWKRTINDPVALKRFEPFLNDDTPDSDIIYVRERGQKRPARSDEKQEIKVKEIA